MTQTLKAYSVTEEDEGTGAIFYAKHAITARRHGANEFGDGELMSVSCHRVRWADQYAPGPVPKLVMIDNGWRFDCHGCYAMLTCDGIDEEDSGGRGHVDRDSYVEFGSAIYCSVDCRMRYRAEQAVKKRLERKAITDLATALLTKLPTVKPILLRQKNNWRPHAYANKQRDGSWGIEQCVVSFEWPGMNIGPGTYRFDKLGEEPHVGICHGDQEAWKAWRASVLTVQDQTGGAA